MTRARCIVTVMNTLERIPGVESVDVDLQPGGVSLVTVSSARELDLDAARAALSTAGYTLVGSPVAVA
jgi:copper chaperone CopZ